MKKCIAVFLFLIIPVILFAQNNPMVAIVPFNPVGVSENEALVITNLFETALVQTGSFDVIEQNQIEEIMDAQAYTLTGCTDESCAVEVGKLLAAEQIILGDLSSIGGKFILNAKIIDVEKGKNIKADKVEAANMGDMTKSAELLAYKLAGLTFTSGGTVQVAQEFGDVLIETTPSGADILVNGVKKGVSPDLITRIPIGTIRIEARLGNLYGMKEVTVTADTARISLDLEVQFGNLFIKSSENNVEVILDGDSLGSLGTGFFDDLPAGEHHLELLGDNVYWASDLFLEADKSTRVDAYPRGIGYIDYEIPEKAEAEISGVNYREIIRGSGEIKLNVGEYQVSVSGKIYRDWNERISIKKGEKVSFTPNMAFTEEHQKKMAEERRESLYAAFLQEIEAGENMLLPEHTLHESDIAELAELGDRLSNSEFIYPDLIKRWETLHASAVERNKLQLQLDNYMVQKMELETKIAVIEKKQNQHKAFGWVSLGTGIGSAILSSAAFILSWTFYQDYISAGEDEWQGLKEQYETWDLIGYISTGAAALGGGVTPLLWLTGPKDGESAGLKAKHTIVQTEIARLETALR